MHIWNDKNLVPFISVLNNHSSTVGLAAYHKKDYIQRAEFVNMRSKRLGFGSKSSKEHEDPEISIEVEAKRAKMDENDREESIKAALERVSRDKKKKNMLLNTFVRVKPEARLYLQSKIKDMKEHEIYLKTVNKFPGKEVMMVPFENTR